MEDSPKQNDYNNENTDQQGFEEQENGEDDISYIYEWVDSMQLSRPKKNISRDFSDALLLAEIIKCHSPRLVDLHNYPGTSSTRQKLDNWNTLNTKVLRKIGIKLSQDEMYELAGSKQGAIENLLIRVYKWVKGIPQNPKPKRGYVNESRLNQNNEGAEESKNYSNNEEADAIKLKIYEKDQEILKLKDRIEMLEKEINQSSRNVTELEARKRELNEAILNSEIDFN